MGLRYALIQRSDEWVLFRGEVELASFPSFEKASCRAHGLALNMSAGCGPVELILHDRFGELRSEWFAAGKAHSHGPSPAL